MAGWGHRWEHINIRGSRFNAVQYITICRSHYNVVHVLFDTLLSTTNHMVERRYVYTHKNPTVIDGLPSQSQWRGALMFSLICAWTNGWTNTRNVGDLRCHRAHYDVTVMIISTNCVCGIVYLRVSTAFLWNALHPSSRTDNVHPCWLTHWGRRRQNDRHFADDTFKRIFLIENVRISIKISLKFVLKSPIDNIPALFQIMAWRRPGDKPLSEAMMLSLLTHICVARPPRVKTWLNIWKISFWPFWSYRRKCNVRNLSAARFTWVTLRNHQT